VLTSVGIDIGSSTSHVVLSRLTIRRHGSSLSSQFVVSDREVLFTSQPVLTPYASGTRIDMPRMESWIRDCYAAAGVSPEDVDTGAVVVTGEALNKQNAAEIATMLARWAGDFICISAGPEHEGMLAAHGSGSVALARQGLRVVNVDVGGGTTKVSLVTDGRVEHVEAFAVGARLVAVDPTGAVVRIEPPAHAHAERAGVRLALGAPLADEDAELLAQTMADLVLAAIIPADTATEDARRRLLVTDPTAESVQLRRRPDRLVFSGGVSEYVYGRDTTSYGDLGRLLGDALRARLRAAGLDPILADAGEGIRATVLGASQFTVQASGQTSYVSHPEQLPLRHLPVVRLDVASRPSVPDLVDQLRRGLRRQGRDDAREPVAVALRWSGPRRYVDLRTVAEALTEAVDRGPLVVVQEPDLAHSLGRIVDVELGRREPLVVLDGIDVAELDFLDIGRPMGASGSFPVTVKSLTFPMSHAAETEC
jgi:ethanolamine utilization protein EutA (predicted chaperonin)